MPTIVEVGASIEGEKIEGHSRDPLSYRGKQRCNEVDCFQFVAKFDVKSLVIEVLVPKTPMISPSAHIGLNDDIVCEQAVISSVKNKYRPAAKSNVSSTHGANSWSYPNQTNVQVIRSHQEIKAAMEKRRLLAKSVVQVIA